MNHNYFVRCRKCGAVENIDNLGFLAALHYIKKTGWNIEYGKCICPRCNKKD